IDIPWVGSQALNVGLEPGGEQVLRRWFVVGDGTLADIKEHAGALRGQPVAGERRRLQVQTEDGQPLVGHWVKVLRGDEAIAWGITDASGQVVFRLEQADYELEIEGFAAGSPFERTISVQGEEISVSVGAPAMLKLGVSQAGSEQPL